MIECDITTDVEKKKNKTLLIVMPIFKGRVAWEQRDNRGLFSPTAQNSKVTNSTG